jgi:glycosyltransferase involved in cell wall biosynthesis
MEHELNLHFSQFGPPGPDSEPPWTECESSLCWLLGGNVFDDEIQKQQVLKELVVQSLAKGHNIQFYANVRRDQVIHLMNRCKASLCLSANDLWPRSLTEAMACGTPAVAMASLISGLEPIRPETGVIVNESATSVMDGLQRAWKLRRKTVRETYFSEFGLRNGICRLASEANVLMPNWKDIVTIERPAESAFKRSLRKQVSSLLASNTSSKKPE